MDMQVVALDILTTKGRLAPEAARAIGEAMDLQIARSHSYDKLATKEQLNETNLKLESVRTELKCDMERLKSDVLRWMFAALTGQAALVVGIIRLIMPHGP
jgi:hypothetical protein